MLISSYSNKKNKIDSNKYSQNYLSDIQGNILQSHGRGHARHILISFGQNNSYSIDSWIRKLGKESISSSWKELKTNRKGLFCSLLLSASGYRFLNCTLPDDEVFQSGMQKRGKEINDTDKSNWENAYQQHDIDAMLVVADDDAVNVAQKTVIFKEDLLKAGGLIISEEQGFRLKRFGQEIEHFGFVDGISQPEEKWGKSEEIKGQFLITNPKSILSPDPWKGSGSYMVYRKLEQNVKLWEENIQELALKINGDPFLSGAMAMGRFKDGTPIIDHDEMKNEQNPENDFTYLSDPEGNRCPYHSHMRKMNERVEHNGFPRITRRAMMYGLRPDLHGQGKMFALPENQVGLLFMCFQKNIAQGFEYLQKIANDPNWPKPNTGQDPLISQGESSSVFNEWPDDYGSNNRIKFEFDRTVKLQGGEYFFAPSIQFLKNVNLSIHS